MAERYRRLYTIENMVHTIDSPVVIEAGALLWDNKDRKEIVQLKIKNITPQRIVGIFVEIMPYNIAGEPLTKIHYEYLDLSVGRDLEFGTQTPIVLKEDNARSFKVHVTKAIYDDGVVWEAKDGEYIIPATELSEAITDKTLWNFYIKKYGKKASVVPRKMTDLWICTCGAINALSEEKCHICKASANDIIRSIEENTLREEYFDDLYNKALRLMEIDNEEDYQRASDIFEILKDYKDSSELKLKCNDLRTRKKEDKYRKKIDGNDYEKIKNAVQYFESFADPSHDVQELIKEGKRKLKEFEQKEEELHEEIIRKKKKDRFVRTAIVLFGILVVIGIYYLWPFMRIKEAESMISAGNYSGARDILNSISNRIDIVEIMEESYYQEGMKYFEQGEYEQARMVLNSIDNNEKAREIIKEIYYQEGMAYYEQGEYEQASITVIY